jgi:CHAT domain-containing protein
LLLGDYDRALVAATRARHIFEALGDKRRLARLDINTANIYHRQDRFAEALSLYRQAYTQLLPYMDSEALGVALHNIAVCLIMLNNFDEAVSTMERVRELSDRDMPLLGRQADYNIAYLFFLRGDYDEALARLRTTRALCNRDGDAYHQALCDLDESEIYLELNLPGDAARLAKEAMERFSALSMPFEQGRATVNLAIASHRMGEPEQSLSLLRRARKIFSRESNEPWKALVAVYESMVLFDTTRYKQAKVRCRQALQFFAAAGLERREILCDLVMVRILRATSRVAAARKLCQAALEKLASIEAPLLRFQAYLLKGQILQPESAEEAFRFYEKARSEFEQLRSSVQGDELKIAFMGDKEEVYERLVQLCLSEPARTLDAIEYMEQAKSRSLADLVFGRALPLPSGTDENTRSLIEGLRGELNWYYHRLEIEQNPKEGFAPDRIKGLRQEITKREKEFLRLHRDTYVRTRGAEASPGQEALPLAKIRPMLAPETTLIEYFKVDQRFWAAIVTRNDTQIVPLATEAEVIDSLRMLEFQMARMTFPGRTTALENDLMDTASYHLRELHAKLFAPIAVGSGIENLIVIPHGLLHRLPFHALMDGKRHLIDRYRFSYAPSASIYAACEQRPVKASGTSLLLGVPDELAPWISEEIDSVASVVPEAQRVIGSDATHALLKREGAHARLVHIATHGMFRSDNPMFSAVRLGDGYLNLTDLYQLRLPVELITLSGCGTGLSEVAAGDELLGLTRGLLYAGARSVLVTLWDVQDQTTASFMRAFYRGWCLHGDKAFAMSAAMAEIRDQFPHPYYWAPFILIGSRKSSQIY